MRELMRAGESPADGPPPHLTQQAPIVVEAPPGEPLQARRRWPSANARWLLLVLAVALLVRVAWVATVQPDPRDGRFDDSVWYYSTGRLLADGEGYVYPLDALCDLGQRRDPGIDCAADPPPTALWAPGYPLVLSALFHLPGDDVAWGRALNVAAGLALVCAVYYLGSRLWSPRAGLLAAAIVALFPSHIFFSSLLMTEPLFAAMLAGALCLALAWTMERDAPKWKLIGLGLAIGTLAMVRPEAGILVAVFAAVWFMLHPSWRWLGQRLALLALGMAVLLVPWTARNWAEMGSPIVGTTGLGQVLLQAHHPRAGGQPNIGIVDNLWDQYKGTALPEREVRMNSFGVRESIAYAVKHPWSDLSRVPDRFAAFYRGDRGAIQWNQVSDGDGKQLLASSADGWGLLSDIYYYTIIGCAVVCLPFWLRRARAQHGLIFGPFAIYSLLWAFVFVGEARYHFPLVPVFAVTAGIGLAALTERSFGGRRAAERASPALPAPVPVPEGVYTLLRGQEHDADGR
ncbi:MAG: glycosyltransferase family 39 protein [Dehalococcoidia bacterium]